MWFGEVVLVYVRVYFVCLDVQFFFTLSRLSRNSSITFPFTCQFSKRLCCNISMFFPFIFFFFFFPFYFRFNQFYVCNFWKLCSVFYRQTIGIGCANIFSFSEFLILRKWLEVNGMMQSKKKNKKKVIKNDFSSLKCIAKKNTLIRYHIDKGYFRLTLFTFNILISCCPT